MGIDLFHISPWLAQVQATKNNLDFYEVTQHYLNGDYPYTDLIENTGVWPDLTDDYTTKENLLQNGAPFLSNVLQHMAPRFACSGNLRPGRR